MDAFRHYPKLFCKGAHHEQLAGNPQTTQKKTCAQNGTFESRIMLTETQKPKSLSKQAAC